MRPLKTPAQVRAEQDAFHARLLAPLDGAVAESNIALRDLKASQPKLFPDFHARCGDPQILTGNADLVSARGEANPNPEHPPQCYPLQSDDSWTVRS
jgi:hypothetical protein